MHNVVNKVNPGLIRMEELFSDLLSDEVASKKGNSKSFHEYI